MRLSHQPYTGSITMKAQFPHFNLHDITLDQIKDTIKSIDIQFIELTTTTLAVGHLVNVYVTVGQSGAVSPAKYNSKNGEEEAIKDLYRKVGPTGLQRVRSPTSVRAAVPAGIRQPRYQVHGRNGVPRRPGEVPG